MTTRVFGVPPLPIGAHRLFGARTLLIDRVVPALERIELEPMVSPGGTVTISVEGPGTLPATRTGLRALRHRLRPDRPPPPVDGPIIDMRADAPQNFSHALMIQLPQCAAAARALGREPLVVLPFNTPGYVRAAVRLFGFELLATDHAVMGEVVRSVYSDVNILRLACAPYMRERAERLHAYFAADAPPYPKRLFVARRGARSITNQAEVEAVLHPRGFATVYPEELSVPEQFRLFDGAEAVVGIHGAALSPIAYRRAEPRPFALVEILPAAHMTNFFRVVAVQQGGDYVAVRGRITAHDARAAYGEGPYLAHSLDPFAVDPASVAAALNQVGLTA